MKKINRLIFFLTFFIFQSLLAEDSLGNLAQYPPTAKDITITTASNGEPILQPKSISLKTGKYYQLTKTGIFIWEKVLAEQVTLSQLIIQAEKQFYGESIRDDIVNFVETLLKKDIFVEL